MTVPSLEAADRIATASVPERLAAAVNVVPGQGTRGALLVIKTRPDRLDALETRARALHP